MIITHDRVWHDHPDVTPLVFSLTCKDRHKVFSYDYTKFNKSFISLARAFAWSVLRRSHSVGHHTRLSVLGAVRYFEKYVMSISSKYRPKNPSHITENVLREYAAWLKNSSELSYRTASSTFRLLIPYLRQWISQPWAAIDLIIPQFLFSKSNTSKSENKKGYTSDEILSIARCVILDISESNKRLNEVYIPKYLGKPPPLDGVAPDDNSLTPSGRKWTVFEYRVWWWENECGCQCLSALEIQLKIKKGAYSFLYGYWQRNSKKRTTKLAEEKLQAFYKAIGAGPEYKPKYLNKPPPTLYSSKWQKPEYIEWVWENECGCLPLKLIEIKKIHNKLGVALQEHYGGYDKFCEKLGIRTVLTIDDLCPYYVGLLLSTALNPSVIQKLRIDCLTSHPLSSDKQSILWTKLRANKAGLTIPANGQNQLAPVNLVKNLIDITAPFRVPGNILLFTTNGRKQTNCALDKGTFGRAIARWFEKHGLKRENSAVDSLSMHAAVNFRPAIARVSYERTGSLDYVQTLLGHSRAETTVDYIGKLPEGHLVFHRGVHIEAVFVGALNGREASRDHLLKENNNNSQNAIFIEQLVETTEAHCSDILNSPFRGQVAGNVCTAHQACLYCANLVVTNIDLIRYFAMINYYKLKMTNKEITAEEYQLIMGERVFMFEEQILPKYDARLIENLKMNALLNPPVEYQLIL